LTCLLTITPTACLVYHGTTGRVFNVTKHAVGVIVNKQVKGRIIPKRINVRIEHVKHSKSRLAFIQRVHENEQKRKQARAEGKKVLLKRQPVGPRPGHFVKSGGVEPELVSPIPYKFIA